MNLLYTFLHTLCVPFIILRLYWKGLRLPAYRERIAERFCLLNAAPVDIWLHAVSLGEVVAATPLIEAMLHLGYSVLVTTMTPTGSAQVITKFNNRVAHQYVPYDLPWVLRRFVHQRRPKCCIIMETELWPNLIRIVHDSKIKLILINGRISNKAWPQYKRLGFFFRPILKKIDLVLAQSDVDTARFTALGAIQVLALGNLKFDIGVTISTVNFATQLRTKWGELRTVLILASTHDNEEQQWLLQLKRIQKAIPGIVLLIAPRHPERFATVATLSANLGFQTALRSNAASINKHVDVVILDSIGELLNFYAISDYAFVGGTLAPIGGHNVLEPISLGVPVFCGPCIYNAQNICETLVDIGGLVILPSVVALSDAIIMLQKNPKQYKQQVSNASQFLQANRGVLDKILDAIIQEITAITPLDSVSL